MTEATQQSVGLAVDRLRDDVRGLATVEYAILITLVTVGGATALYALGVPFVKMFRFQQLILALPFP